MNAHLGTFIWPMLAQTGAFAGAAAAWVVFFLVPLGLVYYAVYCAFSAPLRRQERARMVLDLMEAGFRQGQRPEVALADAARTADPALGRHFLELAAHLRQGRRLSQALEDVPRLLPAQLVAMLRVGEEIGDVRKVLPACRGLLHDADSQTRNGFNYLVIASMVIMPIMPILILILNVVVYPKFMEIAEGYDMPVPAVTILVMRIGYRVAEAQLALALCLCAWVAFYVRGPRSYGPVTVDKRKASPRPFLSRPFLRRPLTKSGKPSRNIEINLPGLHDLWGFIGRSLATLRDQMLFALPWRRRRLQRDFCATLSLLLDAETPEAEAITLAAEATANHVFVRRARRALRDLAEGKPLQEALRRFDHAGEFSWRLANAAAGHGGFLPALSGWMDALEAKAFQQEQTASQLITTGLVLCNGVVAGLIAAGVFAVIISLEQ
jgi:type II secretory pathway component PulF